MNGCSSCNKSISCAAIDTIGGLSHDTCECDVQSVNGVCEIFSKSLRIEIPQDSTEVEDGVTDETENVGLAVYASSSSPGSTSHSEEWSDGSCNEEVFALNIGPSDASNPAEGISYLNLPSPSSVVSAMKGSREKQGIACTKLSVSWSPDVYDPVPTIVSHTVKSKPKRQSKSEKKYGKGKHKGNKASKQSAGKDRKQNHNSNSAKKCYTSLDVHDRLLGYDNQSVNFDTGSPEFYANSFLKASIMKIQMPTTQAL